MVESRLSGVKYLHLTAILTDSAESKFRGEHGTNGGATGTVVADCKLLKRHSMFLGNLAQDDSSGSGGGISLQRSLKDR